MNFPNILTLSRIFLTLIFAAVIHIKDTGGTLWSIFFFALASLTDLVDGYWARKYNLITSFGKIMDPIADKCLILTAMFLFSYEGLIPVWMVMLIAIREILVTAFRIHAITRGQVLEAESAGKIKTVFQMSTVSIILLYRFFVVWPLTAGAVKSVDFILVLIINLFMIGATALTLWSGFSFFRNNKNWQES
ncbi:MAG: CDP-diacylglycerol--glycerol-3-phosphate 3-phosphatidyltransferase [Candidatus Omnitrophica bacterium]|nr:CDP-diacylglycerol--glycerol-3-phosphate 3-phosphatidyltransferase [Candidatus Omnitrophota bacterium]